MIQNNQYINHSEHIGDIQENRVGIDIKNIDFITSLLTSNLYSNPLESFLRESVSNAYDSHVEAGTKEHILLIIDLMKDSKYKITLRDFGVGLSPERFDEIYKNIGSSTKRESNDYIGAFGIGKFAQLSCATASSITSFYNNTRYDYIMYKNEKGINIDKINEIKGEFKNGLEVSVIVSTTPDELRDAIIKLCFFKDLYIEYHDNGFSTGYRYQCNLNDVISDFNNRHIVEFENISYCDFLKKYQRWNDYYTFRIGNVIYDNNDKPIRSFGFVINLPIGSVDITPSREKLQYTEFTKNTIKEYTEKAKNELDAFVNKKIPKSLSIKELYKYFIDNNAVTFNRDGITISVDTVDVTIDTTKLMCGDEYFPDNYCEFLIRKKYYEIGKDFIYKKAVTRGRGGILFNILFDDEYTIYEKGDTVTKKSTLDYFISDKNKYVILQFGFTQLLSTIFRDTTTNIPNYSECVDFTIKHLNIKKICNSDVPDDYTKANVVKKKQSLNSEYVRHYGSYGYTQEKLAWFKDNNGFILYSQNSNENSQAFSKIYDNFRCNSLFTLITVKKEQLPLFQNNRKYVKVDDFLYKRNKFIEKLTTAYIIFDKYCKIRDYYCIPLFKEFKHRYNKYFETVTNSYHKDYFKSIIDTYINNKWYNKCDVDYFSLSDEDVKALKYKREVEVNYHKLVNYEVFKKCGRNDKIGIKPELEPKFD